MPLPTPNPNEKQDDFISRCVSFVTKEKPDTPMKERLGQCYGQWEMKQKKQIIYMVPKYNTKWDEINKIMYIESDLLEAGTYIGLDGIPTLYPADAINAANPTIKGKPIKITHNEGADTVVGFWTKVAGEGKTRVGGYVFEPEGISFIKEHPDWGLSLECDAQCEKDAPNHEIAHAFGYTAGCVVENPAYGGRIETAREIRLSSKNPNKQIIGEKIKMQNEFVEFKDGAENTREAVYANLTKQLEAKGVDKDIISGTMKVLKDNIDSPLPIAGPTVSTEKLMASSIKVSADALGIEEKDMSAYSDFMKGCLKTKDLKTCVADFKAANPAKKQEEKKPVVEDKVIIALKLKLEQLEAKEKKELEGKVNVLDHKIKEIDADFVLKDFVVGVEDPIVQEKMLSSFLANLTRAIPKKIRIKTDPKKLESRIKGLVDEMGLGQYFKEDAN